MRAIGFTTPGDPSVLIDLDLELPDPNATGHDLLVEVRAVSVNPIDTKVRRRPLPEGSGPKVLGWDAAGVVRAVGPEVTLFAPGDQVWYAGSVVRPGTNSELHLVDERIVAHKPTTLDFAEAAAMPLTTITAWELLFDRLGVVRGAGQGQTLLIAIARAPASTARTARRTAASSAGPRSPIASRSASDSEVSTVTAVIRVSGSTSAAAATIAGPPLACTVRKSGASGAMLRAAPATVLGMSCSFRSRNRPVPGATARTSSTIPAPSRR